MDIILCQRRLAMLWFGVSGLIILLMMIQTLLGHYRDPNMAWQWILPNLIPSLSLIVGVLVTQNMAVERRRVVADPFLFKISIGISAFYLLALLLILLLQPFSGTEPTDLMKQGQQLWIAPIQGLVTASIGAFFVRTKDAPNKLAEPAGD